MTLFISTYQLKNNIDQEEFTMERERFATQCMQTLQTICLLGHPCQIGAVFIERKTKLREGGVRIIEICYEHRVLPEGFP